MTFKPSLALQPKCGFNHTFQATLRPPWQMPWAQKHCALSLEVIRHGILPGQTLKTRKHLYKAKCPEGQTYHPTLEIPNPSTA
jgi:hypothetical protein